MDYNPLAERFDAYSDKATTDWELGLKPVALLLEPFTGKKVLDYGCGSGNFVQYLAERGADVLGVDVSAAMIDLAEQNPHTQTAYQVIEPGDLHAFETGTFDAVTTNFVLCTISSENEIVGTLKALHRVLKAGGVATTLNANWEASNGREFISAKLNYVPDLTSGMQVQTTLKGTKDLVVHDYFWSQADYTRFFTEAGFTDIKVVEMKAQDDSQPWLDEREYAPLFIVMGKK